MTKYTIDTSVRKGEWAVGSLLWRRKCTKLSNKQTKPSPTYCDELSDLAQSPGMIANSNKIMHDANTSSLEGSSLPIVSQMKAGMTVEACLVLPLLLVFLMNMGSIIEMISLHGKMQLALWEIGNAAAVYLYALEEVPLAKEQLMEEEERLLEGEEQEESWWEWFVGAVFTNTFLRGCLIEAAEERYLEKSPVVGGKDGIAMWESDFLKENGEMELVVTYAVTPLFEVLGLPYFRMVNRYYGHAWSGYEPDKESDELYHGQVYVTDNAEVYHLFRDCTHLALSIREVMVKELEMCRNQYGHRYDACEKCVSGSMPYRVYVTGEGEHFHYERSCPGLKRTVYSVAAENVDMIPVCGRCESRWEEPVE